MNVVVVVAHPSPDSFTAAIAATAVTTLQTTGNQVDVIDLYAVDFDPVMSAAALTDYHERRPVADAEIRRHGELVAAADALVFVYPTWWSGLPAILKGWLERVLVPGIAFEFGPDGKVRPALGTLRHIVGISTYGSPWTFTKLTTDGGRRTLTRSLRLCCTSRPSTRWIGLYSLDRLGTDERSAFLDRVRHRLRRLK